MGSHQPIRKVVTPEIPDKLYFRIGDVARLCEVPAYVLRFWETEFPQLKPNKGGTGQRLYRKRDVEMALRIKSLLYDQGYTIPGARQVFKTEAKPRERGPATAAEAGEARARLQPAVAGASSDAPKDASQYARLQVLREEMNDLLRMLSAPLGSSPSASLRPKLHALRPRLVGEGTADPQKVHPLRAVNRFSEGKGSSQAELFAAPPLIERAWPGTPNEGSVQEAPLEMPSGSAAFPSTE